jgi:nucleoside-diphosphate-sugar epimerase
MEDIINLIGRAVDRKPVIEYNPSGDGLFMLADISRLKTQLKTLKMISFRDGIERIISGENV